MKKMYALAAVATLAMPLFAADGAATFKAKCAGCHGADGAKSIPAMGVKPVNTPEVKKLGAAGVNALVSKGQGKMPGFEGKLSAEDITAVSGYVLTLK